VKEKNKIRLDTLLVEKNLAQSGNCARALIMSGWVKVDGKRVEKPGTAVKKSSKLTLEENAKKFVSRGGLKLEKAITEFGIDVRKKITLDIGASTGGFTDCLLRFGASKVYALDVGHGQIDWNLRNDKRVIVKEKINCRYLKPEDIGEKVEIVTIDVSFISLTMIIEPAVSVLADNAVLIALIKPQFEVGRKNIRAKSIVKDENKLKEVNDKIVCYLSELGFRIKGLTESPIKGSKGNREFLVCATWTVATSCPSP